MVCRFGLSGFRLCSGDPLMYCDIPVTVPFIWKLRICDCAYQVDK